MADKKISELDQVLQINNDAAFPISQDSGGTPTTYKATITQIGAEIGEEQTFSNLQTTSKNLVGAINELNQGGGGGGSSNANLAPDYDATSTYAVGDWCIYNGTLYQCNTAIPTAEAFDPTHWTAKKVVDAFADIEDELDEKVDTSDFLATLLPIQSGSSTNTKDYVDSKTTVSRPTVEVTTGNTMTYNNSVKYGKMISITVVIRVGTVSANTHTHIATVTEKPVDTSVTVPSVNGTNGTYGGMINIEQSNGNINLYSPTALSNINIAFTATYYQA